MSNRNIYLASKPRYEILDGLRGVAAMLVVAYHLFETYYHGASLPFKPAMANPAPNSMPFTAGTENSA